MPANQRTCTGRLAESGYLLNDRRAGQASSRGWAAWNLLLSLIEVAPELAVELLASEAIYECRQLHWIRYLIGTYVSAADRGCLLHCVGCAPAHAFGNDLLPLAGFGPRMRTLTLDERGLPQEHQGEVPALHV